MLIVIILLLQVRNWLFTMIGLQNPKEESIESRRKYDFGDEVLAWRIKLRKERQVSILFQVHCNLFITLYDIPPKFTPNNTL